MSKRIYPYFLLILFISCSPKAESEFNDGLAFFKDSSSDLYGYLNRENEIKIKPQFTDARDFNGGFAPVAFEYDWGIINTNGEKVVDFQYQDIHSNSDGFFITTKYNKEGLINKKGSEIIPNIYEKVGKVKVKRFVPVWNVRGTFSINNKIYYDELSIYDIDNKILFPAKAYSELDTIINSVALVRDLNHSEKLIDLSNPNSRLNKLDEGRIVELYGNGDNDIFGVYLIEGIVVNKRGDSIISGGYNDQIYGYSEGYFVLEREGEGKGFINEKNEIVIKPIFTEVEPFNKGKAKVTFENVSFYINYSGNCTGDCPTSGWFANYGIKEGFRVNYIESQKSHSEGLNEIRKGNYWEAEKLFSQAIKENPGNAKAYADRGLANLEREYFEDAYEDLKSAVRFNPKNANYFYLLGVAYEKRGWEIDAIPFFRKAIRLDPTLDDAYMKLAYIYKTKLNNTKRACENIRSACNLGNSKACEAYYSFCN